MKIEYTSIAITTCAILGLSGCVGKNKSAEIPREELSRDLRVLLERIEIKLEGDQKAGKIEISISREDAKMLVEAYPQSEKTGEGTGLAEEPKPETDDEKNNKLIASNTQNSEGSQQRVNAKVPDAPEKSKDSEDPRIRLKNESYSGEIVQNESSSGKVIEGEAEKPTDGNADTGRILKGKMVNKAGGPRPNRPGDKPPPGYSNLIEDQQGVKYEWNDGVGGWVSEGEHPFMQAGEPGLNEQFCRLVTQTAAGESDGVPLGWRYVPLGDLRVAAVKDGTDLVSLEKALNVKIAEKKKEETTEKDSITEIADAHVEKNKGNVELKESVPSASENPASKEAKQLLSDSITGANGSQNSDSPSMLTGAELAPVIDRSLAEEGMVSSVGSDSGDKGNSDLSLIQPNSETKGLNENGGGEMEPTEQGSAVNDINRSRKSFSDVKKIDVELNGEVKQYRLIWDEANNYYKSNMALSPVPVSMPVFQRELTKSGQIDAGFELNINQSGELLLIPKELSSKGNPDKTEPQRDKVAQDSGDEIDLIPSPTWPNSDAQPLPHKTNPPSSQRTVPIPPDQVRKILNASQTQGSVLKYSQDNGQWGDGSAWENERQGPVRSAIEGVGNFIRAVTPGGR